MLIGLIIWPSIYYYSTLCQKSQYFLCLTGVAGVVKRFSLCYFGGMKIREIIKTSKTRPGNFNRNGIKPEPDEEKTIEYLITFGFDIDFIRPMSTKGAKNPDVFMMGSIWEIKTPSSSSESTIKLRFRTASGQSSKIIFDLRGVKKDPEKVQKQITELFLEDGGVRRMMIINKDGRLLDLIK